MSIVTGLSLLGGDVTTAAGVSPKLKQFLRELRAKNRDAGKPQVVVWRYPETHRRTQLTRWLRPSSANGLGVLKAGYASMEQPMAALPAQPPQVYVISAPAPAMPAPKPETSASYPPPAPQPMMSYSMPASAAQDPHMPAAMSKPQAAAVQSSYSMSQAQPGMSYRVIYVQPPEEPAQPQKPPPMPAASYPPPSPPMSMSYPSHRHASVHAPSQPAMGYGSSSSSSQPMMSYSMPAQKPATAVQASVSRPQSGTSYRVIYVQPPEQPAQPPAKPPAPSYPPPPPPPPPPPMPYPSHGPAAPAPQPIPEPVGAEPQALFIVVPSSQSSSAKMAMMKPVEPAPPACQPSPGKTTLISYLGTRPTAVGGFTCGSLSLSLYVCVCFCFFVCHCLSHCLYIYLKR